MQQQGNSMDDELQSLKKELKKWEWFFVQTHQRKPNKDDISHAPENIKDSYQRYSQLKKGPVGQATTETTRSVGQSITERTRSVDQGTTETARREEQAGELQPETSAWSMTLNKEHIPSSAGNDDDGSPTSSSPSSSSFMISLSSRLFENSMKLGKGQVKTKRPGGRQGTPGVQKESSSYLQSFKDTLQSQSNSDNVISEIKQGESCKEITTNRNASLLDRKLKSPDHPFSENLEPSVGSQSTELSPNFDKTSQKIEVQKSTSVFQKAFQLSKSLGHCLSQSCDTVPSLPLNMSQSTKIHRSTALSQFVSAVKRTDSLPAFEMSENNESINYENLKNEPQAKRVSKDSSSFRDRGNNSVLDSGDQMCNVSIVKDTPKLAQSEIVSHRKSLPSAEMLQGPKLGKNNESRVRSSEISKKRCATTKTSSSDASFTCRDTDEFHLTSTDASAQPDVVYNFDEPDVEVESMTKARSRRKRVSRKVKHDSGLTDEDGKVSNATPDKKPQRQRRKVLDQTDANPCDTETMSAVSPASKKVSVKGKRKRGGDDEETEDSVGVKTKKKKLSKTSDVPNTLNDDDAVAGNKSFSSSGPRRVSGKKLTNENFVRLNMKVKRYQRGGRGMSGPASRRMQWKNKMKARSESRGTNTCFKCGQEGHWANKCPQKGSKGSQGKVNFQEPIFHAERYGTAQEQQQQDHAQEQNYEFLNTVPDQDNMPSEYAAPEPPPSVTPILEQSKDGSIQESPDWVFEGLRKFGHSKFRSGQEQAVKRILCGLSTLVVLSTGAGKSLCYKLPAYLYAQRSKCITLVISPLVSLMEDQVTGLPAGVRGACLHTNMTPGQREKVIEAVTAGEIHFILVSPEAIAAGGGGKGGLLTPRKLPPVVFACIDEVHCLSEWSHNFRPSYLRVCKVLRECYGVKCFLGLTATATLSTAEDVAKHIGINNVKNAMIRGNPIPDNLQLSVSRDADRDEALLGLLQSERFSECNSVIIYCTRRDQTERMATLIRTCMQDTAKIQPVTGRRRPLSSEVESYHAGLTPAQRKRVQNAFMSGKLRIVVATVAFGMGLDKSDVRAVIHYNLPKSFESYVQEVGRAGRDGEMAHCHLFLHPEGKDLNELRRHTYGNTVDRYTIKKLLQQVFLSCRCKEIQQKALDAQKERADFPDDDIDYMQIDTTLPEDDVPEKENAVLSEDLNKVTSHTAAPTDDDQIGPCPDSVCTATCDDDSPKRDDDCPASERVCPNHERSMPIEKTVMELDIKEEGIATLLCYLELHTDHWVINLSPVYSTCSLKCYGGPTQLHAIAKKCPPVAIAIARLKKDGKFDPSTNELEFNVVTLADQMGCDSGAVKRELSGLQWAFTQAGPRKSGVMIEFSGLGFHFRSPGDLSDEELDEVLDFLHNRVMRQESTELRQMDRLVSAMTSVSYKSYWMCSDQIDSARVTSLKRIIVDYFDKEPLSTDDLEQSDTEPGSSDQVGQLQSDIRNFIQIYGSDNVLTGRSIARVLHGIASPCYPAIVWGRVRRFWRAHLHLDFNLVKRVATQELLWMKRVAQ